MVGLAVVNTVLKQIIHKVIRKMKLIQNIHQCSNIALAKGPAKILLSHKYDL